MRSACLILIVELSTKSPTAVPEIVPSAWLTTSTPAPLITRPSPAVPVIVPTFVMLKSWSTCAPSIKMPLDAPDIVPAAAFVIDPLMTACLSKLLEPVEIAALSSPVSTVEIVPEFVSVKLT